MGFLDLEEQYASYGAYHSEPVNIAIHIIFVWPILFSGFVLGSYVGPLLPTPLPFRSFPGIDYMIIDLTFFVALFYSLYYITLDKRAGSFAAALVLLCWIGAEAFHRGVGGALAWKLALAIQVVSWVSQVLGHLVFEGRAPALLDNLAQAFLMAPFFVLLEVLERLFNYEPTPGFRLRVKARVQAAITEFRMKKEMLLT